MESKKREARKCCLHPWEGEMVPYPEDSREVGSPALDRYISTRKIRLSHFYGTS